MTIWEDDKKSKKQKRKDKRQKRKADKQETRYARDEKNHKPVVPVEPVEEKEVQVLNEKTDEFGNVLPMIPIVYYDVLQKDNLWQIVRTKLPSKSEHEINLKVNEIVKFNALKDPDVIQPGTSIQISLTPLELEEYNIRKSPQTNIPEVVEKGVAYVSMKDFDGELLDNILHKYLPGFTSAELVAKRNEILNYYPTLDPAEKLFDKYEMLRIYIPLNNDKEKKAYRQGNSIHNLDVALPKGNELPNADRSVASINQIGANNNKDVKAMNIGQMPEDTVMKILNEEKHTIWHLISHGTNGELKTKVSGDGNTPETDGNITTEEIKKLALQGAELVYLDACKSALYDTTEKDPSSVQTAAMEAGAQETIGMNWDVSDTIARLFADKFYKIKLAHPEMQTWEIVRQLQLEMKDKYYYPTYWAVFNVLSVHYKKEEYDVAGAYVNVLTGPLSAEVNINAETRKVNDHMARKDSAFARLWNKYKEYEEMLSGDKPPEHENWIIHKKESLYASIQLYLKLNEVEVPKNMVKDKTDKLTKEEAIVEIKCIKGKTEFYDQYIAFVSTHHYSQPQTFLLGDAANSMPANFAIKAQNERVKSKIDPNQVEGLNVLMNTSTDLYNILWGSVQTQLDKDKITKVYLSTEGLYKNLNINSLTDANGNYIIDKMTIINLY